MTSKHQLVNAFEAGRKAYEQDAAKRAPWEQLLITTILTVGGILGYVWLTRHTSLAAIWRFGIAALVAALLARIFMVVTDKLRPSSSV